MYFGKVENVKDPLKLGRVKVRVHGKHDNREGAAYKIDKRDLPWSSVIMPGNTPAINGIGHSVNLLIGSLVCGIFKDVEEQEFIVMGSLPTKTDAVEDNNVRVRCEPDPNANEPIGEYEPPSSYAPEYPYNNVYETESGHVKEYDDTEGHERITERHKSGTRYEIGPNGTKIERIVRDNYQLVVGHNTLEVFGNVKIVVSGQADIVVANDVNLAVGGNVLAEVQKNADIIIEEGDLTTVVKKGDCDLDIFEGNLYTTLREGDSNLTLLEGNLTAHIGGTTTIKSEGLIKLDGDVDITKELKLSREGIIVNTHTHEYTTPLHPAGIGNTDVPTN